MAVKRLLGKKPDPWSPAPFEPADAYAAKAFDRGEATPEQQMRLRDWLVRASGVTVESFVPDNPRATDYRLGRRSIGLQYAALVKWRPAQPQGD